MAQIKKDNPKMEFPLQIARQFAGPLDAYSVFFSLAEAEDYAKNSPLSFVGQVLTVVDETAQTVDVYKIKTDGEIENVTAYANDMVNAFYLGIKSVMNATNAENADNAKIAEKLGTATKGSSIKPIYLSGGTPTECSRTIPSITLNGAANTAPNFYAPTTAGSSGNILKSNGNGAPTWLDTPYIISSYHSGNTWARKWSNGFIECGGMAYGNTAAQASFPSGYAFSNTNYCVALCFHDDDSTSDVANRNVSAQNKTTTGFTMRNDSSTQRYRTWIAMGF